MIDVVEQNKNETTKEMEKAIEIRVENH